MTAGLPRPDLLVVTGDLMETGSLRECEEALEFLTGLRALLGLEPQHLVIVPGSHDITKAACRAYFATCEADDMEPQPPYWPKWRHFASLFQELYRGLDGPVFESAQPWSLFAMPDLRLAVAALNSTMAGSHRPEDDYGWIGEAQAAWFADQLDPFEEASWLRIGVVRHVPAAAGTPGGPDAALLRDAGTLDRLLGSRLSLVLHGPGPGGDQARQLDSGLIAVCAAAPGQHQFLRITPGRPGPLERPPRERRGPGAAAAAMARDGRHLRRGPCRSGRPGGGRGRRCPGRNVPRAPLACCWTGSPRSAKPATSTPRSGESMASCRTC